MDEKEKLFYDKVVKCLTENFRFDINQELYVLTSGDNSVIMKGDMAGYSLASLKGYVATMLNKEIRFVSDDKYYDYEVYSDNEE